MMKTEYKQTKLGLIPEDWEVVKLGDVVKNLRSGVSVNTENYPASLNEKGVLKTSAVFGGILYPLENKAITKVKELKRAKQTLVGGELLISRMNAPNLVGACAYIHQSYDNLYLPDRLWMTELNHDIVNSKHLNLLLNSGLYRYKLKMKATGTSNSMKNISKKSFLKIKIPLPPLPEQARIADCLSQWDRGIALLERLIAQKEEQKKGLMQQLLTGRQRLPGFAGEWERVKLGDVFEEIKEINDGGDHEPLTISAKIGFVSQRSKFDRVIAGKSLSKYRLLTKGDFAYNKGNSKTYPMGCVYLLRKYDSALVPFVYISFRAKVDADIDNMFYQHWFSNHGLDKQLKQIITSGARGDGLLNVNKGSFFSLKIPLPPLPEQKAIAAVLNTADRELSLLGAKLGQYRLQKRGLMQQLLMGRKRLV
ncbi:restriction endonuclease subunit S [Saprospira sp. CCB-QB6]|uniref:restriction endonuclease subunit S n=1 Tax=Saprospira sp. CCB-QB6 TaxID=3023936 RepID=UPI00234B036C|nr:restriction endonuclease subunit S [Saprospira sp. CCB-QB6]WCL81465.1 restriction endonuclease subunit S [Saprospira sp. CCB-QB6]